MDVEFNFLGARADFISSQRMVGKMGIWSSYLKDTVAYASFHDLQVC